MLASKRLSANFETCFQMAMEGFHAVSSQFEGYDFAKIHCPLKESIPHSWHGFLIDLPSLA